MELKHIEAFLTVVEKESFSLAADALYTTQPTISLRIQHLEQSLNAKLFKRINGKKVLLTHSGETVLPYFKEAFELIQKGAHALQEAPQTRKEVLISCPNYMGVEILPGLLKKLYDDFPNIEFKIKVSVTDDIIESIRSGELDIGFAYINKESHYEDLTTVQIAKEQNILVCGPDHPLTKVGPLSAAHIKDERIINYNRAFPTTKIVEQYLQKQSLMNFQTVEVTHLGWIKMMLRKGLGIAFLQKMTVLDELKSKKLIELPLIKPLPSTPIFLIFRTSLPEDLREATIHTAKRLFPDFQN